ncbi:MAG: lytic transglycosylase domain-containing protein [Alphaproteobacteria bacterium]
MKAFLLAGLLALGLAWPAAAPTHAETLSSPDRESYRAAFRAAQGGRWSQANELALQAKDGLLAKVIEWLYLVRPSTGASFGEITAFIKEHPDWPKQDGLHGRAEEAIPDDLAPSAVRAWFEANPPVSATGRIRYAEALLATGEEVPGTELLRKTWIEGNMGDRQEQILMFRHHELIRHQDHVARLDRLLWDGQVRAARDMLGRVDKDHAALAEARLKLQSLDPGVEYALRRVPAALLSDPGLLYDRLRWRVRKDRDDEAREMLLHPPADLVRPELWWRERSTEIHRAFLQGFYSEAQRMAEHHGQEPGTRGFAAGEWTAGWIALRLLKDPAAALAHFRKMVEAVQYPISRSRADYWMGRALEAMGKGNDQQKAEAQKSFLSAAVFSTTYYGQLAALRLDPAARPTMPPPPVPSAAQRAAFNGKVLVRVVHELGEIGEDDLKEVFIKRLATLTSAPEEAELVASLASAEQRPDLAVRLTRQIWHGEMSLTVHGYPVLPVADSGGTERALVLSVIRQESAFDPRAVSQAGALGLMQVMPGTARRTAGGLGLHYTPTLLTQDPDYNIRLGCAVLAKLLDDFGGNYVLALAAYNAGSSRVRDWIRENGDPRSPQVDVIDWIEMIPFEETRNYVQRVLEAVHIYRERLAGTRVTLGLAKDLGVPTD